MDTLAEAIGKLYANRDELRKLCAAEAGPVGV